MALISKALFFVLYVLLVLPAALVLRLLCADPMKRRPDRARRSYWSKP